MSDDLVRCYLCLSFGGMRWKSASHVFDVPLCEGCRLRHTGPAAWPIPLKGDR